MTAARRLVVRHLVGDRPVRQLAGVHALSTGADAFFAVSLAGSLFFAVSLDAARPRIILYLLITMAPFAVVAPLIGPVIDRIPGGHRAVVATAAGGRAAVCLLMAGHLRSLLFYPEALTVLVLSKTYSVAKSALVPGLVDDPARLVGANSHLSRLSTVAGATGGAVAAGVLALSSASVVLRLGALVYAAAVVVALRLPRPHHERPPSRALEYEELHAPGLVLAASAMAVLRAGIGFLTFFLAFALRRTGEPAWFYGAVLAASGAGAFLGTFVAPRLRGLIQEEVMLASALVVPGLLALSASLGFSRVGVLGVALGLGMGANVGRQAFDSLVQHRAPDANRGRAFARFETRFQLAWVVGGLVPAVLLPPTWLGMPLLAVLLGVGAVSYAASARAALRHGPGLLPIGREVHLRRDRGDDVPLDLEVLFTAERLVSEGAHRQATLLAMAALDVFVDDLLREAGRPVDRSAPADERADAALRAVLGWSPAEEPSLHDAWGELVAVRRALDAGAPVTPAQAERAVGCAYQVTGKGRAR